MNKGAEIDTTRPYDFNELKSRLLIWEGIFNDGHKYMLTAKGMKFMEAIHDGSIKEHQKEVSQFILFVELLRLHDEIIEERSKTLTRKYMTKMKLSQIPRAKENGTNP